MLTPRSWAHFHSDPIKTMLHKPLRCAPLARGAVVFLGAALSLGVHAQNTLPVGGIGLGVGYAPQAYTDGDKYSVLPILYYETQRWRIAGTSLDWKVYNPERWTFALRARYALGDGYDSGDAPVLDGMDDRKPGFWMGGAAAWRGDAATLSFELLGDVSGKSKGLQGKLGVERDFPMGRYTLTPYAAMVVQDKDYVNYYYGVKAGEETSGRRRYDGSTAVNVQLGLRASYALTPRHVFTADVGATALGSGIKDSPLVDRSVLPLSLIHI